MANVVRKEACPICVRKGEDKHKDNLIVYEDGGKFCFKCNKTVELSSTYKELYNKEVKELVFPVTDYSKEKWENDKQDLTTDPKGFRGLKKSTCDAYRVHHKIGPDGKVAKQYYPISKDNQFSGVKIRTNPVKGFYAEGTNDTECDLFGQALFTKSTSKIIAVASGELDALSVFQMLEDARKPDYTTIPVVSGTMGEAGSIKQYKNNYEFFNRFEKIILIPDQDEAGQAAIEKIAQSLPKDKLWIVDLPTKDANKMLEDGRQKEFVTAFLWKHRHYSPAGIHGSDTIYDKILEKALTPKIPFPPFLERINEVSGGGMVAGSIINVLAGSGSGKTTLVNQIVEYLVKNKYNPGIVSLEADLGDYGENILGVHIQEKLQLIKDPQEKYEYLSSDKIKQAAQELFYDEEGKPSFYVIDERGDYENLQPRIEQLIITCDCKIIVVDVLSDVFEGATLEFQSKWMAWEKAICKRYGCIFINVIHSRKPAGGQKSASKGAVLTEEDMAGSGSQYKSGSLNIILARDKSSEDEFIRNIVEVHLSKNRQTGWTGIVGHLYYDMEKHTLSDATQLFSEYKEQQKDEKQEDKNKSDLPLNRF